MPSDTEPSPVDLPELTYDELTPGRKFRPFVLRVTEEMVEQYLGVVGTESELYQRYVPPGFAGILGRSSYLQDHRMPPGGFLLGQTIEWIAPAVLDSDIVAVAEVAELGERRAVTIRTVASQDGREVATVSLRAVWPK